MNCKHRKCLVSGCLIGLCTRYDGCSKPDTACLQALQNFHYIPVCPEQLGGLPTPRTAADLAGGDGMDVLKERALVINRDGVDVSREFIAGAQAVLHIAQSQDIKLAMLGVTAALLLAHDIRIIEY